MCIRDSVSIVSVIYIILFGFAFWNIQSYNSKLVNYDQTLSKHAILDKKVKETSKEMNMMNKSLNLSKSIKSNKVVSYRYLAQIANSVPNRVQFETVEYDGDTAIIIQGTASNDQDILKLIENLSSKSLIAQASLARMSLPKSTGNNVRKGFKISVKTKK